MKKLAINRRNFLKGAAATLALSHFNSMAMGVGKQLISTVVLHGRFSLKYSA